MLSKSTFALFAILAAAANAAPGYSGAPAQQCSSGVQKCCSSIKDAKDIDVTQYKGLHGIADIFAGIKGYIALDCSPILGGGCKAQTVCCQNNHSYGLINIGCTPIDIL
ncbi:hypothetical protein ONZ45_g13754 [Pleurotus djamor]|nr:hypothetical protein ONZ45_g13754 [Pleurotus djamor]